MYNALIFIFVLSVLVVVHEFGHYLMARAVGIRVEKFSIGFGPVIFGRRFGATDFVFSLLPLGGYVKLAGENPEEATGQAWEFHSKGTLEKFGVVFAGPIMNALLAFVIFFGIFLVGNPVFTATIGKVLDGTPAKEAGLLEGDRIVAIDGAPVSNWEDVLKSVQTGRETMNFSLMRSGAPAEVTVKPRYNDRKPFIGVAPSSEVMTTKSGPFDAAWLAAKRVWDLTAMIFRSLGLMITGELPFRESVTGPIGIFFMTGEAAKLGSVYLFLFMASLSVSLFVLNLLPIPVLDGGHILFMLIEKLKGSPLKESVKDKMTQAGLVLLLALMAFVIFQDLNRFAILENLRKLWGKG